MAVYVVSILLAALRAADDLPSVDIDPICQVGEAQWASRLPDAVARAVSLMVVVLPVGHGGTTPGSRVSQ